MTGFGRSTSQRPCSLEWTNETSSSTPNPPPNVTHVPGLFCYLSSRLLTHVFGPLQERFDALPRRGWVGLQQEVRCVHVSELGVWFQDANLRGAASADQPVSCSSEAEQGPRE